MIIHQRDNPVLNVSNNQNNMDSFAVKKRKIRRITCSKLNVNTLQMNRNDEKYRIKIYN